MTEQSWVFAGDEITVRLKKCINKKAKAKSVLLQSGEKALGIETGKAHPGADEHHDEAMLQSEEFNLLLASYEKRLTLLEAVYRHLLSDDFCYHIGQLGPDM